MEALEQEKRVHDAWGFALGHGDQLLDWERIMGSTRKDAMAVHVIAPQGNCVTSRPLAVTLPDFTEGALPMSSWRMTDKMLGNWGGLIRVGRTRELAPWEGRLVQHHVHKPLHA